MALQVQIDCDRAGEWHARILGSQEPERSFARADAAERWARRLAVQHDEDVAIRVRDAYHRVLHRGITRP